MPVNLLSLLGLYQIVSGGMALALAFMFLESSPLVRAFFVGLSLLGVVGGYLILSCRRRGIALSMLFQLSQIPFIGLTFGEYFFQVGGWLTGYIGLVRNPETGVWSNLTFFHSDFGGNLGLVIPAQLEQWIFGVNFWALAMFVALLLMRKSSKRMIALADGLRAAHRDRRQPETEEVGGGAVA